MSELTYDGFGINGPDKYRTRIATFSRNEEHKTDREKYGPLFAAAPDLLAALMKIRLNLVAGECAGGGDLEVVFDLAQAAIAKAIGETP